MEHEPMDPGRLLDDPGRLLDDRAADPLEAQLLRSAKGEGPDESRRARILAAVAAAGVLGERGAAAGEKAGEKAGATLGRPGLVRGLLLAGATLGVPLTLWLLARPGRGTADDVPAVSVPSASAVVALQEPAAPPGLETRAAPALNDARDRTQAEAKQAPPEPSERNGPPDERAAPRRLRSPDALLRGHPAPRVAPTESLKDEVVAIQKVRQQLSLGNAPRALSLLNEYRRRFPNGHLSQEATLVKVEALLAAGQTAEAQRAGRAFLARHPGSPYGARMTALLGDPRLEQ